DEIRGAGEGGDLPALTGHIVVLVDLVRPRERTGDDADRAADGDAREPLVPVVVVPGEDPAGVHRQRPSVDAGLGVAGAVAVEADPHVLRRLRYRALRGRRLRRLGDARGGRQRLALPVTVRPRRLPRL